MKHLRNILLILLLAVVALSVLGLSFKMGEMIFFAYKTAAKDPLPEKFPQNSREISGLPIAPKADKPAEREQVKSEVKESSPLKLVEPSPRDVEKVGNTGMKKNMILMPAENFASPAGKAEKPAPPDPKIDAPADKPTAVASTVQRATKPPKAAPKQEMAAKETKKRKEYRVVASSFSTEAGAGHLVDQLKAENYNPVVVQANIPKGQFYRVIVGSYGSLKEAHDEMAELKKLGLQPFCIVE